MSKLRISLIFLIVFLVACKSKTHEQIIFASEDEFGFYQIQTMRLDLLEPTPLTYGSTHFSSPVWSPDGSKIVFQSAREGSPVFEDIWIMSSDGTEQINLTNDFAFNASPDWSPDGERIVFSSEPERGNSEIYIIDADGSNRLRITQNEAYDSQPVWSPNGETIAFVSNQNGNHYIYVINSDDSEIVTRISVNEDAYRPRWSPNGEQIAFAMNNSIWVTSANGSELQKISGDISAPYINFQWSPDGQSVVFEGQGAEDVFENLYMANHGTLNRLTDDERDYSFGSWSPNGDKIALLGRDSPSIYYDLYILELKDHSQSRLTNNLLIVCCVDWKH